VSPYPARIASIDIGSNTCSMALAAREQGVDGRRYRVLEDYSVVSGLGQRRTGDGVLHPSSMRRTLVALRMLARRVQLMEVDRVHVAATAAVREAPNAAEFLGHVQRAVGLSVRVLSGEEEAEATYGVAAREFAADGGLVALIDVGGGSTEIVLGANERTTARRSWSLGSVRCSERDLGGQVPPVPGDRARLFDDALAQFEALETSVVDRVVAVGGTPTTLLALRDAISPYDTDRVHGRVMTAQGMVESEDQLSRLAETDLAALPGMQDGRAPFVVAGTVLLRAALASLGTDELIVSDHGLRYGLLYAAYPRLTLV
jgi:exopolyphosphatase / guanosine-5'-triphosphate,3'-diphosphate pyrophosphatase